MKKISRLSSAGPQLVRDALGSKLMLGFVIVCGLYYVLLLAAQAFGGGGLDLGLALILVQGFVTAESLILYQRKESRNVKHLSVFCLIAMIAAFLMCLFLGAVLMTVKTLESGEQTEEIMEFLAETDFSADLPYMIATVAYYAVSGLSMLFLWKALGMSAALLEYKGELKNWFLPAAITLALSAAMKLALNVLQPGAVLNTAVTLASVLREGLLAALLARMAAQCRLNLLL